MLEKNAKLLKKNQAFLYIKKPGLYLLRRRNGKTAFLRFERRNSRDFRTGI